MNAVALCDLEQGIDFLVQREGVEKPFWVNVRPDPDKKRFRPTIGVLNPRTTQLADEHPTIKDTPAAAADAFEAGDRIVQIGDVEIKPHRQLLQQLRRRRGVRLFRPFDQVGDAVGMALQVGNRAR